MADTPLQNEMETMDFLDFETRRQDLLDRVYDTVSTLPEVSNDRYTLRVKDVKYRTGKDPNKKDHRSAILTGNSLKRPITGTYELTDNVTGAVVSKARKTLLNVPWMTDYGTFVRNGTEYVVRNQLRLDPGVFVHYSNDGFPEAQINTKARTGSPFRTYLEPETGVYHMRIAGRKVMLYPVLKELGMTDEQMQAAWGNDIWKANASAKVPAHTVTWLREAGEKGQKYMERMGLVDDDPDERMDIEDAPEEEVDNG